jgi:hypothetical protein
MHTAAFFCSNVSLPDKAAAHIEHVSREMSFLVEMVVSRGVDGDEFLQTSRSAEAQHALALFVETASGNSWRDCFSSGRSPGDLRCR